MITKEEASRKAMAFLESKTVGVLATTGLNGQPSVSPLYYIADVDFSINFITSHHTQKFKNMLLNPKVAFCVGTGPEYETVNIHGMARVMDEKERETVMAAINNRVGAAMATWPIKTVASLESGGLALIKITPIQISYLDLSSKSQLEDVANYFYKLLP